MNKSFIVLLLQLIQTFLSALTIILIARYLGANEYGKYVYLLTSTSILPLLAGLGSEHVFIMEASKYKRLFPYLFGNAFFIRVFVTIFAILITYLILIIFDVDDFWIILLLTSGSFLAVFSNPLFVSFYRVKGIHIKPWLICIITPVFYLIYLIVLSKISINIYTISLGFFISNFITIIVFIIDVSSMISIKFNFKLLIKNFKSGMIFSISQVFDFAFARIDIFILQYLVGNYAVGIYAAGQRVVSIFQLIPSSFHVVELPEFHRISNNSIELLSKFRNLRIILIELSLIVFGLLIINSNEIIKILFGSKFYESISIVNLLSISGFLLFISYPYYMLAEAVNKIKQRMFIRIYTFIATLIFVYILILFFGIIGAAFGLIVGQFLFLIFMHNLTNNQNGGFNKLVSDLKILLVAMAAGSLAIKAQIFIISDVLKIFISSSIYLILFFLLGYKMGFLRNINFFYMIINKLKKTKN